MKDGHQQLVEKLWAVENIIDQVSARARRQKKSVPNAIRNAWYEWVRFESVREPLAPAA